MNEAYSQLALNYDNFMEEVPYDKWLGFIESVWGKFDLEKPQSILDLCCGTGNVTFLLAEKGYQVCGIDNSCEMLAKASKKAIDKSLSIRFFDMDMTDFMLPHTVDAVVCCCDGLNYAVDDGDLESAFSCVYDNLHENGVFIFDLNTEHKFKNVLGNKQYSAVEEDFAYFWQNEYDDEEMVNTYYVTLFKKENNGMYDRSEEYHWERAYTLDDVNDYLKRVGFDVLGVFNNYQFDDVNNECERFVFIAQKK